ncbi:hypothetical protein DL93DRAFT_304348 [Clavulina sp. PMI_390]|nr:hypothetical protein DL93DRAFT_304348 [Clavulina sp. PMI_390]
MNLDSFCSSLRSVADQLETVGDPHLPTVIPQIFSPHTRIERAKTISHNLRQAERILESLEEHLTQTELYRDSLRSEYARAVNSICPALQLPEEVLRLIFTFHADDEHLKDFFLTHVCRQWRATASACPRLWTTIYASDPLPMIQRALGLSSNHPIDLIFSGLAPQTLRGFEQEMGSMQTVVNQIQTRSISKLLIEGDAINGVALRNAFGRESTISVLLVESIEIYYAQSTERLDMQHVEFPRCSSFTLEGSCFPILSKSQLSCRFLTIIASMGIPHYFIQLLQGFKNLEALEFQEIGIIDVPSDPVTLPTLEELFLSRLTVDDFVHLSAVLHTDNIPSVYLNGFPAHYIEENSASVFTSDAQILTQYLNQHVSISLFICRAILLTLRSGSLLKPHLPSNG